MMLIGLGAGETCPAGTTSPWPECIAERSRAHERRLWVILAASVVAGASVGAIGYRQYAKTPSQSGTVAAAVIGGVAAAVIERLAIGLVMEGAN